MTRAIEVAATNIARRLEADPEAVVDPLSPEWSEDIAEQPSVRLTRLERVKRRISQAALTSRKNIDPGEFSLSIAQQLESDGSQVELHKFTARVGSYEEQPFVAYRIVQRSPDGVLPPELLAEINGAVLRSEQRVTHPRRKQLHPPMDEDSHAA